MIFGLFTRFFKLFCYFVFFAMIDNDTPPHNNSFIIFHVYNFYKKKQKELFFIYSIQCFQKKFRNKTIFFKNNHFFFPSSFSSNFFFFLFKKSRKKIILFL